MRLLVTIAATLCGAALAGGQNLPEVSVLDAVADEGDPAAFEVRLSIATQEDVTLSWTTENVTTAPDDYAGTSGQLVIQPGQTLKKLFVPTYGDLQTEGSEAFRLRITGASNAVIRDGLAYGAIRDGLAPNARCDFNGDRHSDILVQYDPPDETPNPHTRGHDIWAPIAIIVNPDTVLGESDWRPDATGDFDGDGTCDLLWSREAHTPDDPLALLVAVTPGTHVPEQDMLYMAERPGKDWHIVGAADVTSDGITDVLWWNPVTRALRLWVGGQTDFPRKELGVAGCSDDGWEPAAVARLSADGATDILWHGTDQQGAAMICGWQMRWADDALSCQARACWMPNPDGGKIVATGDFDSDGYDDILRQEPLTHELLTCFVRERQLVACAPPSLAGTEHYVNWEVVGPR